MEVVVATNNLHKLAEFQSMLQGKFDRIYSLQNLQISIEVEETGSTFYENALLKAQAICRASGKISLADDSGLIVNCLNGQPGVWSKRYAGIDATDSENNAKLLQQLKTATDRTCYFETCLVLLQPNGTIVSASGRVEGSVLRKAVGKNGFGYDPLFFCNELNKSFGQASQQEKNAVSHRARATQHLLDKLC